MHEKFPQRHDPDKLRDENAYLKMKLMLEHGATLNENGESEIPPEIENIFLQNVLDFEKQFQERNKVKVFDKIGRPLHFKAVAEIKDEEIEHCWEELRDYINRHGLDISACSPRVSYRELYRFTIEELFELETDDISLPGWVTHFIYDEFYPDPVYDNTHIAVDFFLENVFRKDPVVWKHFIDGENIRFNQHKRLSFEGLENIINRFRDCFEEVKIKADLDTHGVLDGNNCTINGRFRALARNEREKQHYNGTWQIVFRKEMEYGHWVITDIDMHGILL